MSQLKQADRKRKKGPVPPSSTFCSIQTLSGLNDAHSHWGGQPALQSTDSNAKLIQKHSHGHSQKQCKSGHPAAVKLTQKLTITRMYIGLRQYHTWNAWLPSSRMYFTEPVVFSPFVVYALWIWDIRWHSKDGIKLRLRLFHCWLACPSALSFPWIELLTTSITHCSTLLRKVLPRSS